LATGNNFNKYIIKDLTPNSPAVLADIRPGDKIVCVNHWPSYLLTTQFISKILSREEGKLIKMTLRRDGKKIKKEFRLQNLI
jgi:C-terminal processing protease CtpA/Prc